MKRIVVIAALAATLTLTLVAPAYADEPVHPEIQAALDEIPGGLVLGYRAAHWPVLDMTMTIPNPLTRAVGTCATGYICAYTSSTLSGTKLSWGSCGTYTPPSSFVTKSIANARAAGSVAQARNGTVIVASAASGTWANVTSTVTNIRCLE